MIGKEEDKKPHDLYDRGYKMLLSFTKIFQQLMEGYVDGDWKGRLDYAKSERIDKTFILEGLEKEEADVLYKVPLLGEDREIVLYILIEQQSTVDYALAFRVLAYLTDVWRDIYKNTDKDLRRQKSFRLPPVFPIVLYNGDKAWTAALSVRELVEHGEILGNFIPNVLYHLIDIPRYDVAKLKQIGNSLAGVFLLEHQSKEGEFDAVLHESLEIIDKEGDDKLWLSVVQWVIAKLRHEMPNQAGEMLQGIDFSKHNRKEIRSMLETMPKKMFTLGEQKGRQEGRQEGVRDSIVEVLQEKFGQVPREVAEQLGSIAQPADLALLLRKAAMVQSLEDFDKILAEVLRKQ